MRFVSRAEVEALGIGDDAFVAALEEAFQAAHRGAILWRPKSTISQPDGAFYIGALACWPERGLGLLHNIMGAAPGNVPRGEPHYGSYQLVADYRTSALLAVIDGLHTSTMLPACITALAARHLARPDSTIAAFIGAGLQARVNLAALAARFPLKEIRILSRTARSAEGFAREVRAQGLAATILADPAAALRGAHIIVSSVPGGPDLTPFLDPDQVPPGAFVSAVDVGRSWQPGFERFDRVIADDRAQAAIQHAEGRLAFPGRFDSELPELLTGARPGRQSPQERIVLIHPGHVVGILGMTALIHERLRAKGGG